MKKMGEAEVKKGGSRDGSLFYRPLLPPRKEAADGDVGGGSIVSKFGERSVSLFESRSNFASLF